jgi:hypothetical protein
MMGAVCEKRDRLWASYHEALTAYIAASEVYNLSLDHGPDPATVGGPSEYRVVACPLSQQLCHQKK